MVRVARAVAVAALLLERERAAVEIEGAIVFAQAPEAVGDVVVGLGEAAAVAGAFEQGLLLEGVPQRRRRLSPAGLDQPEHVVGASREDGIGGLVREGEGGARRVRPQQVLAPRAPGGGDGDEGGGFGPAVAGRARQQDGFLGERDGLGRRRFGRGLRQLVEEGETLRAASAGERRPQLLGGGRGTGGGVRRGQQRENERRREAGGCRRRR